MRLNDIQFCSKISTDSWKQRKSPFQEAAYLLNIKIEIIRDAAVTSHSFDIITCREKSLVPSYLGKSGHFKTTQEKNKVKYCHYCRIRHTHTHTPVLSIAKNSPEGINLFSANRQRRKTDIKTLQTAFSDILRTNLKMIAVILSELRVP